MYSYLFPRLSLNARCLLASVLLAIPTTTLPVGAQTFGIFRELWTGLSTKDGSLNGLTNSSLNPNWPSAPTLSYTKVRQAIETEVNFLDGYGQRLRGFVVPPATGTYQFWIASDDASALFLSQDEDPAHLNKIAWVDGATGFRQWDAEANQQSNEISMEAGRRYYVEVLHKEAGGGDALSVRWQLPSGTFEEPITNSASGTRLIPYRGVAAAPAIYSQSTNLTLLEGRQAAISVLSTNQSEVSYRWQVNGVDLSDANADKSVYVIPAVRVTENNGQIYHCVLSTSVGSTVSKDVSLTVLADTVPPLITHVISSTLSNVLVSFSEALQMASALDPAHFALSGGSPILSVDPIDPQTVMLHTIPLVEGASYNLTVNDVKDLATQPNVILANTRVQFVARELNPIDVGNSIPSGVVVKVPGGWDVSGGGATLAGKADQFQFEYQQRSGDFDLAVRVNSWRAVDLWSRAGLMARETLDPGSRFSAVFTSSGLAGCFFESRGVANGLTSSVGSIPANAPATWLRLKRSGFLLSGFVSYDSVSWMPLGQASIGASTVFVGLAVQGHSTNATATAEFRDFKTVQNPSSSPFVRPSEPLGPCTRKTGLVISELLYQPAPRQDGLDAEFIEIYNTNPYFEDLSGYRLAGSVAYTFPANTTLPGGGFLLVAASPQALQTVYGVANAMGPYSGSLRTVTAKTPGLIQLLDAMGSILLEIPYEVSPPWPVGANGEGHSIVLSHPSYGEADPRAWARSDLVGGSPEGYDTYHPRSTRAVQINEFLAHTDPPLRDYVELFNPSSSALDLSGTEMVDVNGTNRFVIPAGTMIPARGFVSFDEVEMGFAIPAAGGTLELWAADHSAILDAVTYEAQAMGVPSGRWPDGASEFYPLQVRTPAAPNSAIQLSDVVINEIMYKPISGNSDDEYVELFNRGASPVDLSDWRFTTGISFTLPAGTVIGAGHYLVLARNRANLFAHYDNLTTANTLGDYTGKLPHPGRLALAKPDVVIKSNGSGGFTTNRTHVIVDEVRYETGGRWGHWANGGGSSLELIDPHSNHRLAYNWADSDETAKAAWVNIESFGQLDNGASQEANIAHIQVGIMDVGECLVDEIEVRPGTQGPNYVKNAGFESGMTGWQAQGCLVRSTIEPGGYLGGQAMHLRCSDRVWTGANSLQGTLTNTSLSDGKLATLRLKARWLRGWPEVLLRLNGNWMETTGVLPVPSNLGTPGLPNSRAVKNAGPAIYDVSHTPALPAAGQPAVVTARLHDPDGIGSVMLNYRIDPATNWVSVPMTDSGTGGDAVAGDGVLSATLPGQNANRLIAFWISAVDGAGSATRFPAMGDDNRPTPEGVILFGDSMPSSTFGVYHLWVTKDKSARWAAQPNLSNESWDSTFVYGDRVIYDVLARFSGSPYHQSFNTPDGALCHYKWTFPDDDKFLGATSFNKIHQPGNGPNDDDTLQREQTGYWLLRKMGLPWNYRRLVAVYVNGNRRGSMMEDTQTPDSDVVKEHWPNDNNGYLFKLQPWFEFDPSGTSFNNNSWNTLNNYTTLGGGKKLARYRWNYLMRKTPTSASDYSKVFELVNAANLPTNNPTAYSTAMESVMDVEQWIRTFAVEHSVGNWDSVGNNNGQNMYAYVGQTTRWNLLVWDLNILLASSTGPDGPSGDDLFKLDGVNAPLGRLVAFPQYKRAYWRAYKELADRWYQSTNYSPLMDAKYAALQAEGIAASAPSAIKGYMSTRLTYLASQLAAIKTAFAPTTNHVVLTNGNLATLSGTAPVDVATLTVNGHLLPITWLSPITWRVRFPAEYGTNSFTIQGFDLSGNALTNAATTVQVISTNVVPSPTGSVVLNEILYSPALPGEDFVEIYNSSPSFSFDLSGWRIDGLGYVFPIGSYITNGQYLVIAKDRFAVASLNGTASMPVDVFPGELSSVGGSLALVKPGASPAEAQVISRVTFEARAPWPLAAQTPGASLQLVDPSKDAGRVGNWGAVEHQWQFFSVTTNFLSTRLQLWLDSISDVYVDDVSVVQGITPGVGQNLVRGGDFEGLFTTNVGGPWVIAGNQPGASAQSTNAVHSGLQSLHLMFGAPGAISANLYQELPTSVTNGTSTLSFWYLPNVAASNLVVRVGTAYKTNVLAKAILATPGKLNSIAATLPAFPPLWLNEVEASNSSGLTDVSGQRVPWFELYNSGPTAVDLSEYTVSADYGDLPMWSFPPGARLSPGQFKVVFADAHPEKTTESEWHTDFVLMPDSGSVVLWSPLDSRMQVLDYLNYDALPTDRTYGAYPDGQPFDRMMLARPTPAAPNSQPDSPTQLRINEWMSSNTSAKLNAATGKYDDWFEIYNPGPARVSLSGLSLKFGSGSPLHYLVPAGYDLAPGAHLLVWADKGAGAGNVAGVELHTNFRLAKSGGTLGIYAPDGSIIDQITYLAQGSNESNGRCPDGGTTVVKFTSPTPGTANECIGANTPPSIAPIADQLLYQGQTLSFQIPATDMDLPAQHLAYSLDSGAPAEATLNPVTGTFTWTPGVSSTLGRHSILVRVTDDGTPPRTSTATIGVTVLPALRWDGVTMDRSGHLLLHFSALPGKTYRVEFKDEIEALLWQSLTDSYVASGVSMEVPLTPGAQQHRFYRLVQVD